MFWMTFWTFFYFVVHKVFLIASVNLTSRSTGKTSVGFIYTFWFTFLSTSSILEGMLLNILESCWTYFCIISQYFQDIFILLFEREGSFPQSSFCVTAKWQLKWYYSIIWVVILAANRAQSKIVIFYENERGKV